LFTKTHILNFAGGIMDRKDAKKLIKIAKEQYVKNNIEQVKFSTPELAEQYACDMKAYLNVDIEDGTMVAYDQGILVGMELALNVLFPKKSLRYSLSGETLGKKG